MHASHEVMLAGLGIHLSEHFGTPFTPLCRYDPVTDQLLYLSVDVGYRSRQTSDPHLELLLDPHDDQKIIGVKIMGFSRLARGEFPSKR